MVSTPARVVVDLLHDSTVREPALEGKGGHQVVLARIEAGEADAGDGDEAGFLRKDLDVAERFEQPHVLSRRCEDAGRGTNERASSENRPHECHRFRPTRRAPHFGQCHSPRCVTAATLSRVQRPRFILGRVLLAQRLTDGG